MLYVYDLHLHSELARVLIEPSEHSDEAAEPQAGCRRQLTHLLYTPSLFLTAVWFTEMLLIQLHNILIWSHESTHVCMYDLSVARIS